MPIKNGKIYIIPTRFGLVFLLSIAVMILVGAAYQNNLVNLLAFFLLSIGFVAMVQTHNNLKDVQISDCFIEPGFAGGEFKLHTVLHNTSSEARYAFEIKTKNLKLLKAIENAQPLLPHSYLHLRGVYHAERRGKFHLDRVCVNSVFPLGLFYAWKWLGVNVDYYIYPQPAGDARWTLTELDSEDDNRSGEQFGDDFHGHRRYTSGDSQRHIDWKARARGRPLLIKEFNEGAPHSLLFDLALTPGSTLEHRLSQMTAWIERARLLQLPYGLRLEKVFISPQLGERHRESCLKELATFEARHGSH